MVMSNGQDNDRSSNDEEYIPDDEIATCDSLEVDDTTGHDTGCSTTVDEANDAEHPSETDIEGDSFSTAEAHQECTSNSETHLDVIFKLVRDV